MSFDDSNEPQATNNLTVVPDVVDANTKSKARVQFFDPGDSDDMMVDSDENALVLATQSYTSSVGPSS